MKKTCDNLPIAGSRSSGPSTRGKTSSAPPRGGARGLQGGCAKAPASGTARAKSTTVGSARGMLFALWNDACQVQGWTVRDDAQRHRVTREALGRNEDQPIPSWSNLDKVQISLLKQRLGVLAENLTAAMAEHPLHLRAQALWGIQASARAMCSLGPAYSQAATCAWEPYVRKVLYDLSRGQTDHFPDLPLTHHSCVDLTNLSKLLWNRLYSALRKWNAAHTLPLTNLKAYALQLRKDCMASA